MLIEPKDFADRLYILRSKTRMSRKTLAAKVGVSVNTIRAWEDGVSEPKARGVRGTYPARTVSKGLYSSLVRLC